jgi:hypothetical protein
VKFFRQIPMSSQLSNVIQLNDLPAEFRELCQRFRDTDGSRQLVARVEEARENLRIDYDTLAIDFNQAYFTRNYLKCLHYLRSFSNNPLAIESRVFDLGGGAGPFSLAARHYNPQLETILIDRSSAQVLLARTLSLRGGLRHVDQTCKMDILTEDLDDTPLRIASYWACENSSGLIQAPSLARVALGKRCIVLDYPHIVQQTIELISKLGGQARNVVFARQQVCSQLAPLLGQRTITYAGAYIEFNN